MKKFTFFIVLFFLLAPLVSFASTFQFGDGTETCFDITEGLPFTTDISDPEIHLFSADVKVVHAVSPLTIWGDFDGNPGLPYTVTGTQVYDPSLAYSDSRVFTLQATPCESGGGGGATSTATSTTMTYHETLLIYCVIIFMLSLMTWAFLFSPIRR